MSTEEPLIANSVKRSLQDPDENGVILKDYCGEKGNVLYEWAKGIANLGENAQVEFCFYEDIKSRIPFVEQLRQGLVQDMNEYSEALLEEGFPQSVGTMITEPKMLEKLVTLVQKLMNLYQACLDKGSRKRFWKVKFDINCSGGCTKYHDDFVDLRFTTTLAGDGTVVAGCATDQNNDNNCIADGRTINWKMYDACGGEIPEMATAKDLTPDDRRNAISSWNRLVSANEIKTGCGDLTIMQGGKQTKRPCLHRAPYCADEGLETKRFLIIVEMISQEELEAFLMMEQQGEEDDDDEF